MTKVRAPLIMLAALTILAAAWAVTIAGDIKESRLTLGHVIDQTGDTAHVQILHVLSGVDSFDYVDSFWIEGDTTVTGWLSPLQARRITPEVDTSSSYTCSLDCGTNIYGFEWDASGLTQNALADLIDTLVDSINNVAGIKDTVVAHDSVTYIKLISKFAQLGLEGEARWTLTLADELAGTETDSTKTTVEMICDSLTAAINGEATLADTLVAVNLADTAVQITGRQGWTINLFAGDTAQTVLETVAEKATKSRFFDTFPIFPMLTEGYNTLQGTVILRASAYAGVGYGLSDSGMIKLMSRVGPYDGTPTGGTWTLIVSDTSAGLPTTLSVAVEDSATHFGELLYLIVSVIDSTSDTAMTVNHDLEYWFMRVRD